LVLLGEEEGIDAWVLGYGNSFEYGDPVGDIIESIDDDSFQDSSFPSIVMDYFISFLFSYYDMDVDDFTTDQGTNWEDVSEQVKMDHL
jgi:hypothetical protein